MVLVDHSNTTQNFGQKDRSASDTVGGRQGTGHGLNDQASLADEDGELVKVSLVNLQASPGLRQCHRFEGILRLHQERHRTTKVTQLDPKNMSRKVFAHIRAIYVGQVNQPLQPDPVAVVGALGSP